MVASKKLGCRYDRKIMKLDLIMNQVHFNEIRPNLSRNPFVIIYAIFVEDECPEAYD